MKKIIENLWYGNIEPCNDYVKNTDEIKELRKKRAELYDKLQESLNEKEKKLLDEYSECEVEIFSIHEKEIFEYSFRLGFDFAKELLINKTKF